MRKFQENLKVELRHIANITDFVGEFPQHVVALCFFFNGFISYCINFSKQNPQIIHSFLILHHFSVNCLLN